MNQECPYCKFTRPLPRNDGKAGLLSIWNFAGDEIALHKRPDGKVALIEIELTEYGHDYVIPDRSITFDHCPECGRPLNNE